MGNGGHTGQIDGGKGFRGRLTMEQEGWGTWLKSSPRLTHCLKDKATVQEGWVSSCCPRQGKWIRVEANIGQKPSEIPPVTSPG